MMLIFMRLINIDFLISLSHLFRDFVNYFKERVVPKANRLGKWALGEVNILLLISFIIVMVGGFFTF